MTGQGTRIVKSAGYRSGAFDEATFHYDDLLARGEMYLEGIEARAEEIIERKNDELQKKAQEIFDRVREQGREEGLKTAEKVIAERVSSEIEAARTQMVGELQPIVDQLAARLQEQRHDWMARWEKDAISIGLLIAERILQREITNGHGLTEAALTELLDRVGKANVLTVRMHPVDYAAIGSRIEDVLASTEENAETRVVSDGEIQQGGCVVETAHGSIDNQPTTQLNRMFEELMGGSA